MFTLTIHDRKGTLLKQGDIVKISERGYFQFFSEVKWLEKEQVLAPFHTFCFSSFEKVNSVPKEARKSSEERYNIWYLDEKEKDPESETFEKYLMGWRECEHMLKERCYRIKMIK